MTEHLNQNKSESICRKLWSNVCAWLSESGGANGQIERDNCLPLLSLQFDGDDADQ